MNNKWRRSQVTHSRDKQINENCENFQSRTTIILNPRTQLECGHRQSHSLSWNWARSSSKNNSENCPILCLSSVRLTWDMFTIHHTNAVSTQKHLGSDGTSMGQRVVSRTLKAIQWLMLWVERNKDNVNKSTFFWKRMHKLETTYLYRCISWSNVHFCISARWSNAKTDICNREMSCGTHQTYDGTEIRTSSRSLRSSSQKADTQWTWCQNWQNLSLDRLINSVTVATGSAQETTSIRCEQSSGNIWKLIDGSMETRQRCRKPCRHRNRRNVHRRPQGVRMAKRAGMAPGRWRKVAKAVVPSEWTRAWAGYEYCSNRNKTRPNIWLETVPSTELETSLPTAWGSRQSRRVPSKQTKFIKQSKYCFDLFKTKASRMFRSL